MLGAFAGWHAGRICCDQSSEESGRSVLLSLRSRARLVIWNQTCIAGTANMMREHPPRRLRKNPDSGNVNHPLSSARDERPEVKSRKATVPERQPVNKRLLAPKMRRRFKALWSVIVGAKLAGSTSTASPNETMQSAHAATIHHGIYRYLTT